MARSISLPVAIAVGVLLCASSPGMAADSPPPDKSAFTLFNPTPRELMRELGTDRPDVTESPYTVDAGHVQVEMSFAEWRKGSDREETAGAPINVKLGLTHNVDVQFLLEPYIRSVSRGETDAGAGDSLIRVKFNLWGNDGGPTALAIMPFISFPTGADAFSADGVEGGVVVPFLVSLPHEFALTFMGEIDWARDENGHYDTFLVHTASLGHDLIGDLGGYVEYIGVEPLGGSEKYQAILGTGLTYLLNPDVQLDAGVTIGLNSAADDLRVFAGITFRI